MVVESDSAGSEESFRMWNVPVASPPEQQFLLQQLQHLSSSGITGQQARRRAIPQMFPDPQQKITVSSAGTDVAVHDEGRIDNVEMLQSARLPQTAANADPWEAAFRHFSIVSVSSCFLLENYKGCPQPSVFDDSVFGMYIGSLVQNTTGVWELAVRTDVSQCRCRVISRSPWWDLSCDDDVWLHEQATMNRAQNLFVDEQLARIQTNRDESCCYFC